MRCVAVRFGSIRYCVVGYGAVRGFAVRGVRFSSFGRLCLLISGYLSITCRRTDLQSFSQRFMSSSFVVIYEHVIVFFLSCLTRRLIACRHSILICIDYDDKNFREHLIAICVIPSRLNDLQVSSH